MKIDWRQPWPVVLLLIAGLVLWAGAIETWNVGIVNGERSEVYLPSLGRGWRVVRTSAKKGVVWFGDLRALRQLGVSWAVCPAELVPDDWPTTIEPVVLLSHAAPIERAIEAAQEPETAWVMFWNEPDLQGVSPQRAAILYAQLEQRAPNRLFVVGNIASDIDWLWAFAEEFAAETGQGLRSSTRIGMHCYEPAEACMQRIAEVVSLAQELGLAGVWVTEFGRHLGTERSMRDAVDENQQLVAFLEGVPLVERYAYFASMIPESMVGPWCDHDPTVGWIPLAYEYHGVDVAPRLTVMGRWYAEASASDE